MTRESRLFEMEHLRHDLRRRSVRGAAVTLLSQGALFLTQLAGMAALARLLLPADFGVFGKTVALTGFIMVLRTGGLSLATVQRAQITHEQVSTLFWLNIALGIAAGGVLAALSPLMAWFYHDPRVLWLALALAGAIVIDSLSVQHAALMQRQMRFTAIGSIGVAAKVFGFGMAIYAAWRGAGFWALAVQQYANSVAMLVLMVAFCRWWPGLPRRGTGVRPMVKIGANQTGFGILNFANRNIDNVLIGRFVSDVALGFYSQAYRLLLLPVQQINSPVTSVVLPSLSRLQHEPERYARFYYRAIGAIAFLGMPVVSFLLVEARAVILIVLGKHWLPVVPIFQALGVAAFLGTFNVAGGWIYSSLGRTDRQFRWQLLATPLTVGAFFAGLPWGALGVAASYSAVRVVLIGPALAYCFRGTPISLLDTARTLVRPATAALGAAALLAAAHVLWGQGSLRWIGLDVLGYGVSYLAIWLLLPGGRSHLAQLLSILDELRSRKK